jgi:hypothetical protein
MRSIRVDEGEVPAVPENGGPIVTLDLGPEHLLELDPAVRDLLAHNFLWLSAADATVT